MIKKYLVIGIILLFIFMSINPSFAFDNVKKSTTPVSRGNTLYVGGNGTGNYTRIQDAVENASDGDTVFVYDDSSPYKDVNLNINKSITLQGENMTSTIIYCWGCISSDNVTIAGFTFQTNGPALEIDGSSNSIIENCAFNNSVAFLSLDRSNNIIIRNCSFSYLDFGALNIEHSDNIEVCYCDFFNNFNMIMPYVIRVLGSRGIKIHHCNIGYNTIGGVIIIISSVQFNFNNIYNNSVYGYGGFDIGFLSSFNSRNNWWGSSQGPNITINWYFNHKFNIRQVDNADNVFFSGKPLIMGIIGVIWLLPWLTEPVVDAGQQA